MRENQLSVQKRSGDGDSQTDPGDGLPPQDGRRTRKSQPRPDLLATKSILGKQNLVTLENVI